MPAQYLLALFLSHFPLKCVCGKTPDRINIAHSSRRGCALTSRSLILDYSPSDKGYLLYAVLITCIDRYDIESET